MGIHNIGFSFLHKLINNFFKFSIIKIIHLHRSFIKSPYQYTKNPSPFRVLSYNNFFTKIIHFGSMRFASRHTFIINPEGKVARIYRNVSPKKHSDEIIADLKTLGADNSQNAGQI